MANTLLALRKAYLVLLERGDRGRWRENPFSFEFAPSLREKLTTCRPRTHPRRCEAGAMRELIRTNSRPKSSEDLGGASQDSYARLICSVSGLP